MQINSVWKTTVLCMSLCFMLSTVHATPLEQRLTILSDALEQERKAQHIPGMAIAIIKDDKVIFSRGFGFADVEKMLPVTPATLFATGSTGKAFTATLIGMLVDEQKMQWDDPLQNYLPDIQFDVGAQNQLTIRDMLSHRSGYSRNDILWANGKVSRTEMLQDAMQAEPLSAFRQSFNYNNIMFLAAGMASAKGAQQNWDELINERIFKPLGMSSASVSFEQVQTNPLLAKGYRWQEVEQVHQQLPMRNLNNIAPAGGINASVLDMAQWLRLQLNRGKFDGKRLISSQHLSETHSPQIKVADGMHYGLGWFLREWQGKKVVEHGGNIDGFGAQVAMLPEENIGFVLLTNLTASPLQQTSINMVWEHLLSAPQDKKTADKQDWSSHLGEYIANFGPFKDAVFTVKMKNGFPAVDVPGQTLYELNPPNADGKWLFKLTDTIAISFVTEPSGAVNLMRLHQNGMDFELPRKGVSIKAEVDPAELQPYLGQYFSKGLNANSTVLIQNHRLSLDVPGQMVYELHLPDEQGMWRFRINKQLAVTFDRNEDGEVTQLNFYRGGAKNDTMKKVVQSNQAQEKQITVSDILALRKSHNYDTEDASRETIQLSGKITLKQAGITGQISTTTMGDDHFRLTVNLGKYGLIESAVSPEQGAAKESFSPFTALKGKYLKQAKQFYPMPDVNWRSRFKNIAYVKTSEFAGKPVHVVRLTNPGLPAIVSYIDMENGDVIKQESQTLIPGIGSIPTTYQFSDYRLIEGRRVPFKVVSTDPQRGEVLIQFDTHKSNLTLDKTHFQLTAD